MHSLRVVHHVEQHPAVRGLLGDPSVDLAVVGRGDGKESAVEVARRIVAVGPRDAAVPGPGPAHGAWRPGPITTTSES